MLVCFVGSVTDDSISYWLALCSFELMYLVVSAGWVGFELEVVQFSSGQ